MADYSRPEFFRSNKPELYIKMWYDSQLYAAYSFGTWHHTLFSTGSDDRQSSSEAKWNNFQLVGLIVQVTLNN